MLTVFLIFIVLLAFIFLGFPIFMSLLITGILFLTLGGNSLGLTVIKMFGSANSLSLLAIPYFVIAGNIIMKARITDKLVNFADAAVGWLPGGLGHVNVLTSMIFGGIQGSGCADAAAIGGMLIPAMEKQGYDKDYSVAVTAGSSMLSPIIPPSIAMILYSYYTEVPVGRLFMGALVPGILLGLLQMGVVYLEYRLRKYDIPRTRFSLRNLLTTAWHSLGALMMPLIILSGICFGIVTPTESGVLAILYGLLYGFCISKTLKWSDIPGILIDSDDLCGVHDHCGCRCAFQCAGAPALPDRGAEFCGQHTGQPGAGSAVPHRDICDPWHVPGSHCHHCHVCSHRACHWQLAGL